MENLPACWIKNIFRASEAKMRSRHLAYQIILMNFLGGIGNQSANQTAELDAVSADIEGELAEEAISPLIFIKYK
jgi:hypothetical protein